MRKLLRLLLLALGCCGLPAAAVAANPFLSAPDGKPISARFKGTEWSDEIGPRDFPLAARVVTQRIAQAPWGAIFKISFENIASRTKPPRELFPIYYIATDDQIVLFNEEKPEEAAARVASQPEPPDFDPGNIRGLCQGTRQDSDKLTATKIVVQGDRCTYQWSHNSGHFTTVVWQKGVGLIEYAQGYGARKDGYRLKREGGATKGKR